MPDNLGKKWEELFKRDFLKSLPGSTIDRIYDPVGKFKGVSNICDFIGFKYPNIFYLECKSCKSNTFNFAKLTQYKKLKEKWDEHVYGSRIGVVLWFIENEKVFYIPFTTIVKMKEVDGKKSVNCKKSQSEGYYIIDIPFVKQREYIKCDFSLLQDLKEGD